MGFEQPPRGCCCALCEDPPPVLRVSFGGVAECPSGLCPDYSALNGSHEIPHHQGCVWAANGPHVYDPSVPHQITSLPACNAFLVQVTISRDGDFVTVCVDATSGSAGYGCWEKSFPAACFDCRGIGPLDRKSHQACQPTVYVDFSQATCSVC